MKATITRLFAVCVGVVLAMLIYSCTGGQIQYGPDGKPIMPSGKPMDMQAMFDSTQLSEQQLTGEGEITDIKIEEKVPQLTLQPPSLDPRQNEFFIRYCCQMKPDVIAYTDLTSPLYKGQEKLVEKFIGRLQEKLGFNLKTPSRILFILKLNENNVLKNWLVVVTSNAVDIQELNAKKEVIGQFDVYKIGDVLLVEHNGMLMMGTREDLIETLDPNVDAIFRDYFNGSFGYTFRFIVNSPRYFGSIQEFIDVDENKPVNYIAGMDVSYLPNDALEAIMGIYVDEFVVMKSAVKIDSNRINKEKLIKAMWGKLAKYFEVDKEGVDQIQEEKYEEIKDSAADVDSLEQIEKTPLEIDQSDAADVNIDQSNIDQTNIDQNNPNTNQ